MKSLAVIKDNANIPVRNINDEEYKQISEIIDNMELIKFINVAKAPLVQNYGEMIDLIDDYINKKIPLNIFKSCKIQNFLSSIRGYVDTFAHTLSEKYGRDSNVYSHFGKFKNEMYDITISYKFVEALRNYKQSIPINNINCSFYNNKKVVNLNLQKKDLLDGDSLSQKKKDDIDKDFPNEINVTQHLTNMFSYLLIIHNKILDSVIDEKKCKDFFEYKKIFEGKSGYLTLLDISKETEDVKKIKIVLKPFRFDEMKMILSDLDYIKPFDAQILIELKKEYETRKLSQSK